VSGIEAFPLALATWSVAAVWALFALITWPPVARWLPSISMTWPAFQRSAPEQAVSEPPVPVAKGFLDFHVDALKAGEGYVKSITRLIQRTSGTSSKLSRDAKRFAAARGDAQKSHKVASDIAKDVDEYAAFIEGLLPELRAGQKLFTEGLVGYLETSPAFRNRSSKSYLEALRSRLEGLRKTVGTSREKTAGVRNSISELRRLNVSQRVNSATDRLVEVLTHEDSEMEELEAALQRVDLLSKTRLQEMG